MYLTQNGFDAHTNKINLTKQQKKKTKNCKSNREVAVAVAKKNLYMFHKYYK